MDIEKLIKEYKDKGGSDERLVRKILQSKRTDRVQFMERMIHKYSSLKDFPFSCLMELSSFNDEIDYKEIEKYIDKCVDKRTTVVSRNANVEPEPPKGKKKYDEQYVHELIALFRKSDDFRTDSQILTEKSGAYDISLMELFEYICDTDREAVYKSTISGRGWFLLNKGVYLKPNKFKVLAKLEFMIGKENGRLGESELAMLSNVCELSDRDEFLPREDEDKVTIYGHKIDITNQDKMWLNIKKLFVIMAPDMIKTEQLRQILNVLRKLIEQDHRITPDAAVDHALRIGGVGTDDTNGARFDTQKEVGNEDGRKQ